MTQNQEDLCLLIDKIQQENQQALGELYDATANRIYGFVLKLTNNKPLTEEIVGDLYMQVWRNASKFDAERATPIAWLLMMARSRAFDALRREQSRTRLQDAIPDNFDAVDVTNPDPCTQTLEAEEGSVLQEALQLLNEQQRQMIALAFYRDMTHNEIANYINQPLGTVKTTLRRSQAILRAAMTKPDLVKRDCYEQA